MKKFLLNVLILCTTYLSAQEYQWTSYNFNVASEDVEVVGKIMDDFYSEKGNKNEGVSVYLFENHFNDNSINFSHSIVFTGTLDAMGAQYNNGQNTKWDLFIAKISQYLTKHSAASGSGLISYGKPGTHPVQNIYWLDVEDPNKFKTAFTKYNSKFNPADRRVTLGNFRTGRSPEGENHYVLVGVNDFKTAFDTSLYRKNNKAANDAWKEYMKNNGDVRLVRSTTRVMLGKW